MTDELVIRIHGEPSLPTLIYLPGLHGDWTLIGSFRSALGNRVRFVEVTYPRTVTWSLDDYAAGVESALAEQGISHGWLLGESFSSQVVWPLLARNRFHAQGVILAGGFVRHPMRWIVPLAERSFGAVSLRSLRWIMLGYAKLARFRFRNSPETFAGIQEFIARWTEPHRQAATHRLHLIARNDPSAIARQVTLPVYALTGAIDPIVAWPGVRHWLKQNCPGIRQYRIFWYADHNVLCTAPQASAEHVLQWIAESTASASRL